MQVIPVYAILNPGPASAKVPYSLWHRTKPILMFECEPKGALVHLGLPLQSLGTISASVMALIVSMVSWPSALTQRAPLRTVQRI